MRIPVFRRFLAVILLATGGCAGWPPTSEREEAPGSPEPDGEGALVRVGAAIPRSAETGSPPPPADPTAESEQPLAAAMRDDDTDAQAPPPGLWSRVQDGFRLPAIEHERIEAQLRRYADRQRYFDVVFSRAEPYLPWMLERIEARDLPAELLLIPVVESAFQPFAYSHSQAGGLWQFRPATGRRFGLAQNWWYDGRRDVLASTEAALDYLEYLHGFFDGDWLLAIAAYNGGEGRVQRAVRANTEQQRPTDFWSLNLPAQTQAYVPRVLALRAILASPDEYGISLPTMSSDPALAVVELEDQVDLALAAEMAGISVDELYRYNPGFNRWATPPDGPHRLAVPTSTADRLRTALAERADEALRWRRHRVARGETLSGIASEYRTSVDALSAANDLDGTVIRAGDHLLVPVASRPDDAYALSSANRRRSKQAQGPAGRERAEHRVRQGDSWWEIARAYDVPVRRLAAWNGMAPDDVLHPGQRLTVWTESGAGQPSGAPQSRMQRLRYTVRAGDSLYAIARSFNVRTADIRRWNALKEGQLLQPGQELELRIDVTEQAEAS